MTILQARLAKAGLSRQVAKGAPVPAATYAFGLESGSVYKQTVTETEIPATWMDRNLQGYDRTEVRPSHDWTLAAYPDLVGLLLLGALGTDTVTGAAAPYTHTFTPANDLPYVTGYGTFNTDFLQLADCKVNTLELSWENPGHVKVVAELMGCGVSFLGAAYVETTPDRVSGGYLSAGGGSFSLDGVDVHVASGSLKIDNKLAAVPVAASVLPADVVVGEQVITWSMKFAPENSNIVREILTGTPAGASVANTPYFGAAHVGFVAPGGVTLVCNSPAVRYSADYPEAKPAGGPAEMTLTGETVLPSAGGIFAAVLVNAVATY